MGEEVKYPHGYLEFKDTYGQNFNGYTHVYEVQLFNGVVDDITGCRIIPEIYTAAAQTGSNTISAHRTDRNKIPTPTAIFLISPGSTTLSPTQPEVSLYLKYIWRAPNRKLPNLNLRDSYKQISNGYSLANGHSTCLHEPLFLFS